MCRAVDQLSVMLPMLPRDAEAALSEEIRARRITVSGVSRPTATQLRLKVPGLKNDWHFDDSDDDRAEEEAKVADRGAGGRG